MTCFKYQSFYSHFKIFLLEFIRNFMNKLKTCVQFLYNDKEQLSLWKSFSSLNALLEQYFFDRDSRSSQDLFLIMSLFIWSYHCFLFLNIGNVNPSNAYFWVSRINISFLAHDTLEVLTWHLLRSIKVESF